jgi:ABC-type transport system involved in multi-copper enzyme maturation permease subunit
MEIINNLYMEIKPVLATFIFELKKQWKKFIIFSIFAAVLVLIGSYLPYYLIEDYSLPATQAEFFQINLGFITQISIFATCFFFGGIICSEFGKKTGYIIFTIINKYKTLVGKFLGSFIMTVGVLFSYYFTMTFLGLYFYDGPLTIKVYYSFGIAVLYILALSSFVTFFSSIMKNVNITIITTVLILLVANMIVDQLIVLWVPEFEPIYSLNHMSKLISYIFESDFPTNLEDRYEETTLSTAGHAPGAASEFTIRLWLTPSILGGIAIALTYIIVFLTVALIIFKKRQL